ncbi:hypothetical protein GCM10010401_00120 [Rarobacter faecitabidus]|uniref:Uncharacterized protein n=1 Tax=Rarobacter faecitabidus TaxID=13243 RepID=A0A542ZWW7_RARFA|nr:hypothetical protein [Rarobacter faecitabidus]TQL64847.1 hypothetical protein FB461_1370 [Rarobacter faecitabidus]
MPAEVTEIVIDEVAPVNVVMSEELSTGDLLAITETGTVTIPLDPPDPFTLSVADGVPSNVTPSSGVALTAPDIAVSLPALADIEEAEVAADGTISYSSNTDATVVVQPLERATASDGVCHFLGRGVVPRRYQPPKHPRSR